MMQTAPCLYRAASMQLLIRGGMPQIAPCPVCVLPAAILPGQICRLSCSSGLQNVQASMALQTSPSSPPPCAVSGKRR